MRAHSEYEIPGRPAPAPMSKRVALTSAEPISMVRPSPPITLTGRGFIFGEPMSSTPDNVPGVGEMGEMPGLILAAGCSGHGFGIGLGAGHLITDLVTDTVPIVDPKPYCPDRFRASAWGKVADF